MENFFVSVTEIFGLKTVLSSATVCLIMAFIKKKKPDLSVRAEILIRFLISAAVHAVYLSVTKGDFSTFPQSMTEICGVSMLLCGLINGNADKADVRKIITTLIPTISEATVEKLLNARSQNEISAILTDQTESRITQTEIEIIITLLNAGDKTE